jgi:hypothetical protein
LVSLLLPILARSITQGQGGSSRADASPPIGLPLALPGCWCRSPLPAIGHQATDQVPCRPSGPCRAAGAGCYCRPSMLRRPTGHRPGWHRHRLFTGFAHHHRQRIPI